jgi:hypothetical protein
VCDNIFGADRLADGSESVREHLLVLEVVGRVRDLNHFWMRQI